MPSLPALRRALVCALLAGAAACRGAEPDAARPPDADFVLSAGDSSYWVTSEGGTIHFRGAPLELARVDGRFYELYVADDDRSYQDAVLVGQRIFRRDLVTGDSLLVYEDTIVWDTVALFPKGALWKEDLPAPVFYGMPVVDSIEGFKAAMGAGGKARASF